MTAFEIASRKKIRFPSQKGDLTSEQLWDLPLISPNKFDLDTIARGINGELRSITEDGFVQSKPDPRKSLLETALEIVKHVIAVKQKEAEDAASSRARAEKRRKLLDALASKEEQEISSMSKDEIMKQLQEIDGNV